ncbi:MAG: exodeoxyribonuclease VII large subunit [Pseudomonadales bacterium]|nr:exodeoxyribonuclease VII large subunit [Pseudomonadales bacterium]
MSQISPNREVLSVSALTKSARRVLEGEFPMVFVEGEISNFSKPASGHWYFTLKDAKSQVRCAMFKGRNRMIRFAPQNGLQILVRGKISLYEGRGEFQMITEFMEEAGDGALRRAFEKLKTQLDKEGLFTRQQPLPTLIQHLAIITSPSGAAIQDVLQILRRRFPAIRITILPVQVQGQESTPQIVNALTIANNYSTDPFDAILLTRGGGALEDLWSFNTEPVARAIAASQLPVVSAVGHETDFTIADYVADLRAPTPSAAAELLSPDMAGWITNLSQIEKSFYRQTTQTLSLLNNQLRHLQHRLRHPGQRLQDLHQRLDDMEARLSGALRRSLASLDFASLGQRLSRAMQQQLEKQQNQLLITQQRLQDPTKIIHQYTMQLDQLQQRLSHQTELSTIQANHQLKQLVIRLEAISPLKTLKRGYAIVTEANATKKVITATSTLKIGDKLNTQLMQGQFVAEVIEINQDTAIDETPMPENR